MALTQIKRNIFPVYLNADPVAVTADDTTYTVVSSSVTLGSGVDLTLDDADIVGLCVNFNCPDSTIDATVTFSTAAGGASKDKITFGANGNRATVIWTEEGWRVVNLEGATLA